MASFSGIQVEADPLYDAIETLVVINRALAKRHGAQFRALERRIEAVRDEKISGAQIGHHDLGGYLFVFTPPKSWTQIIQDARALGLIGRNA